MTMQLETGFLEHEVFVPDVPKPQFVRAVVWLTLAVLLVISLVGIPLAIIPGYFFLRALHGGLRNHEFMAIVAARKQALIIKAMKGGH